MTEVLPSPPTTSAKSPERIRVVRTVQLGMSWFPEQAGNGLDRVYHALIHHLPDVAVTVRGVVAGSDRVATDSRGRVRAFASEGAPLASRLRAARRLTKQAFDAEVPDLVAAHFALYAAPVLDALRRLPFVMHFHGPWAAESAVEGSGPLATRAKYLLERTVYRRADRFVVLSSAFREVLCESYGIDPDLVRIVPGGVEAERFDTGLARRDARLHLGWPTDRPIVLSVRRLAHRMGLDRLIAAMEHVREREPDVLLLIAGKGPIADELRGHVAAAGLGDHVGFLGFVPETALPTAYRAADISIVPTTALEGFGLTTVESLAAGTPVLVTPRGGLPEVVRDLSPSLVLGGAEVRDLAEGLIDALSGTLALPDASTCQKYARDHFSWERVAANVRDVYEEVLR